MSKQLELRKPGHAPAAASSPRMAGGARRQQIVDVAMRLFSERGFRGTTTKEIAQAAGVSEAIIFRHFATKEDLYTAIIDHKACAGGMADMNHPVTEAIMCGVGEAVAQKDDRAVFEGIATAMMEHHQKDPEFLRLLLYSALEGHQLAQMFWDRNVRQMYETLGAYIHERQRDGAFRAGDPRIVVRALLGMITHHSLNNTLWDTSRQLLDITDEHAAREFTEILLKGVTTTVAGLAPRRRRSGRGETGSKRATGSTRGKKKK